MVDLVKIIGDVAGLARKASYDRNPVNLADTFRFAQNVAAGAGPADAWTEYIVPAGKIVYLTTFFGYIGTVIATAGREVFVQVRIKPSGAADYGILVNHFHNDNSPARNAFTVACPCYCFEGDKISGRYKNKDTIAHWMQMTLSGYRFDAL